MFDWLHKKDWRESPAHLLLLSKFLRGDSLSAHREAGYWEAALKEKPAKAIDRFIKEGMLKPASLAERLDRLKIAELKQILKSRQLKLSGSKAELVQRLVENGGQELERATKTPDLYSTTSEGEKLAQEYIEGECRKESTAEKSALDLLSRGAFSEAARIVVQYEASRVFPRGIVTASGVIPMDRDEKLRLTKMLEIIFGKPPEILADVDESHMPHLRLGAGMMLLWGTGRAKPWVPEKLETGFRLDTETSCRMLMFYARNLWQAKNALDHGIALVEIMGISDGDSCEACKKIVGKKFKIKESPVLPYAECTHERGCVCTYHPVFE